MRTARIVTGSLVIFVSLFFSILDNSSTVYAADSRQFNAGRIIDDAVFTNSNSMTVQEIQNFLNSKVVCDTWGTKTSELGEGTRRQWMANRGIYPPFRCINDYYENPSTGTNNYGKESIPAGAISAAQIIYNYSKQYNINPQSIIATLQKENGMITDEWPTPKQFTEAMGFGCPDNQPVGAPACDPAYKSFATQIYQAARHFRGYMDNQYCNGTWCTPYRVGQSTIKWNPNSACGTSSVYIENKATSALYSYTPYRPNDAALNAQYGIGDGCSAYGNRNFYLYFTDWFGSVYGDAQITTPLTLLSAAPADGLFTDGFVEASFIIKNNSAQTKDLGYISIAVRDSAGNNYDFGTTHVVLAPYQEYLYRKATNFTKEDRYTFWITSYHDNIWDDNYPSSVHARRYDNKLVQKMPTLTVDPQVDSELRMGKTSNVSFTAVNNSAYPINLGYIAAALRSPSGQNADLPLDNATSIAANATYTYTKPFVPKEEGDYRAMVVSTLNNGITWNNANYPVPTSGGDGRSIFTIKPNPTLTEGPKLNIATPRVGQNTTFTFKVRNHSEKAASAGYVGLVVRDPNNMNVDVGGVELDSLSPNQEYTYTGTRAFNKPGTYTAWIVSYKNGTWNDNLPASENETVLRKITFTVRSNPTLTQGLTISNSNPRAGELVTGTFKVANFSTNTVNVNKNLCYILRGNSKNYDLGCLEIKSLAAGEERTFTASRVVGEAGDYKAYFSMFDGGWHDNWSFDQETGTEPKTLTFKVKSNPTLTQGLAVTTQNPHEGDSVVGTFKVANNSTAAVSVNKNLCYIVRSSTNKNYDFGCLEISTLQPGQEVTYTGARDLPAGIYRASFSMFDGSWHDNWSFDQETGTEPKTLNFTVKSSPVLIQGLSINNASPKVGDTVTGAFALRNVSAKSVTVNKALCFVARDTQGKNQDFGCLEVGILTPGQTITFSAPKTLKTAGMYKAYFSMFDGSWHDNWSFDQETGTESKTLSFTVAP